MAGRVLAVVETEGGKVRESSFEIIGLARRIAEGTGGTACAAVLGVDPSGPAAEVARRGADHVYALSGARLAQYTAEAWTAALAPLVGSQGVTTVLFSHSPQGWDVAPRLAARLGMPAITEAVGVDPASGVWTRLMFNGKLQVSMRVKGTPHVATLQKGAFPAFEGSTAGAVESLPAQLPDAAPRQRFVEVRTAPPRAVDLAAADVIVSGGRALGGPEKFVIIKELAEALGGQVGASRPVTDSGWLPHEHQVGSSGVTVKPKLYVAAGISGAVQHLAGMKQSGFVVAINKDKDAPIFEVADVGVVGDLFEIVPALTRAVKEARGRG